MTPNVGSTSPVSILKSSNTQVSKDTQKQRQNVSDAVGSLSAEYPCFYNTYRGTLYVGFAGILFQGSKFFFQQRVGVEWKDVCRIEKTEHSVVIILMLSNEDSYEFTAIQHVDRVWSTLMNLHHESITGTAPRSSPKTPKPVLLRTLTDPLPDLQEPTEEEDYPPERDNAARALAAMSEFRSDFRSLSLPTPVHLEESIKSDLTATEEENGSCQDSINQQWTLVRADGKKSFSVCVVKDRELPCSMDAFFETFLSDTAKHSIPSYMQNHGDSDFVVSPWKVSDDGVSKTRTIEYTHPVNAPMAPPTARARKEQRYKKYEEHGLCVETQTFVKDVPMTDCFFVIDRMLVEPKDARCVVLTTEFDIRFVKSTMFRAIISSTTQREFKQFLGGMVDLICGTVGGKKAAIPCMPQETEATVPEVLPRSTTEMTRVAYLGIGLLILVLLFQVWIMYQIQGIQAFMVNLQNELHQTCSASMVVPNI